MEGYYKVYFETKHLDYQPILEELNAQCEKAVWYFHPGGKKNPDRPHIHGLVLNCKWHPDSVRRKLKKVFSLTITTEYAVSNTYDKKKRMSELSYPKYLVYMTKGQYDPVSITGFTSEECDTAKSLYSSPAETKTEIIYEIEKITPVKKKTQWELAQIAQEKYEDFHEKLLMDKDEIDLKQMCKIVIDVLHNNKTMAHQNTVVYIMQDIQSRIDPDSFMRGVLRRL